MSSSMRFPFALTLMLGSALAAPSAASASTLENAVLAPGSTQGDITTTEGRFGNNVIRMVWRQEGGALTSTALEDRVHNRTLPVSALFTLTLASGERISNADLRLTAPPKRTPLATVPSAARMSDRLPGQSVVAEFTDPKGRFDLTWRLEQRDGSPYLRESVSIVPKNAPLPLKKISLLDTHTDGGEVVGDVQGSPIAVWDTYLGIENPLSESLVFNGRSVMSLPMTLPIATGHEFNISAVAGIVRHGQMRRDFQIYVERERTHPYRPFLNYNSWYDIGYFTPYTQKDAENRITRIGEELVRKRGVRLNSYLFDDGWDDRSGQWNFSADFPQGFKPLCALASSYGAAPGVWLSPWGGYAKPKEIRVANGKKLGLEIQDGGLDLSGQRYYAGFHKAVMTLLMQDCVNQFKFDGTGNASQVAANSIFNSDFDAAIHLIADIYRIKPDTFINLTTGTYPSPFWLRTADSIWRGGEDDMLRGVGTKRQRWITYRDSDTYHNIVVKAPLFPLNSLMLHGIIYAQKNQRLNDDPGHDFPDEVHSFFATGTDEQELYVTPDLLKPEDWDVIASTAKWARANADVLKDSHWVGGDPGRLEPYGWASWTPKKAFLTFRNPDEKPRSILIEPRNALELPADAPTHYSVKPLWARSTPPAALDADRPTVIQLAPFEVMTLELKP